MKRYNIFTFLCAVFMLLTLSGCEFINSILLDAEEDQDVELLTLSEIEFESDYKRFTLDLDSSLSISDTTKLRVFEVNILGDTVSSIISPRLISVSNNRVEKVATAQIDRALVIVDMTMSEEAIMSQKSAVERLLNAFTEGHLYVAFMWGESISRSVPVTQYILDHHFVPHPSNKFLLRSILSKIDEMKGDAPRYYKDASQEELWRSVGLDCKRIIVFSDGETYLDNQPIDPLHFQIQKQLSELPTNGTLPCVDYINFAESSDEVERDLSLLLIVDRCRGAYYDSFKINNLLSEVIDNRSVIRSDYELQFENPDGRLFMGGEHCLLVDYIESDSTTYSGSIDFIVGSVYNPIIVNGMPKYRLIAMGFFYTLLLISIIYIVLQIIVPFILYILFRRRYVSTYKGPESVVDGVVLSTSCYYCKSEFERGDIVIAKCKHTMHESCWEENGYKCPDYGARCTEGIHYYNRRNVFDGKNSSIYLKWSIGGCIAGFVAWVCNMLFVNDYNELPFSLFSVMSNILGDGHTFVQGGIVVSEFFGLCLTLFTSILVATLLSKGNWLRRRIPYIVTCALLCCVILYVACAIALSIYFALEVKSTVLLIDWLPWLLLGLGMVAVFSYNTNVDKGKAVRGVLITLLGVFVTIYVWKISDLAYLDTRISQLLTCLIYSVGFCTTLAMRLPTSRRYFLRVSGAIKDMDIALYKWFNSFNNYEEVVIGKSVNCDICMSWDLSRSIAPSQLKLIRKGGAIYIIALDYGVKITGHKRELKRGERKRLYHGEGFSVGRTKFMYVEMDV